MNAKSHSEDRMAPPVSRFYRPELDVIRFLAFGLVFLHHSIPMHDKRLGLLGDVGPLGICLFFVLSSFLITELLRIEKQRTGTIRIRAFYIRRVLRIWPLYFLFLALAVLIGILQPDLHIPVKAVLAFVLLAGNWYAAAHGFVQGFAGPLWSISLEEQFYVIWPSACRFLNKRFLTGLSVLLIPVGVVATYYLAQEGALRSPAIWVNTFVQFQMFAMGALLAIGLDGRIPRLIGWYRVSIAIVGVGCLVWAEFGAHLHSAGTVQPGLLALGYLSAGVGASLMIVAALGVRVPPAFAPIVYLGKISYGLYVFHSLFIEVVNRGIGPVHSLAAMAGKFLLAFSLTILGAVLSYRLFESPFIRMKERFAVVQSRGV